MEKSNNHPSSHNNINCLIDTDVLINWLAQEIDPRTNKELWKTPHQIIKLIEDKKIKAFISIINLLEVRFVLRRKKDFAEERIKKDIAKILEILEVVIPDEIDLLRANEVQTDHPLGPSDALLVSAGLNIREAILISRDKTLLTLALKFLPTATPEEFLTKIKK